MPSSIEDARLSLRTYRWEDALSSFGEIDRTGSLAPDDLVDYSSAAWFGGDVDTTTDLLERAYAGYERAGRGPEAALTALRLARLAMMSVSPSVMAGWVARAQRLLEGRPESGAHAWLAVMRSLIAAYAQGDFDGGAALADEALSLARQHDSPDVESLALVAKGNILLRQGMWREGLALVEEGAAAAASERVEPRTACDVICLSISAFADLGEYGRADEWIARADRWMRARSIQGYRGLCRVHRAELKRIHGEWQEAEREALEACGELERFRMLDSVGFAYYQIGEIRLRLGDVDEAAAAFRRAVELGHHGQPGMALLMLARGDGNEAANMIAASLSSEGGAPAGDRIQRSYLLAAQVEIALAGDDLQTAERAGAELERVAGQYECDVLNGLAAAAGGLVALRLGNADSAVVKLRSAARFWQRARVPYEWARARAQLGRALLAAGDEALARLELGAARAEFERLGAGPDAAVVEGLLGGEQRQRPRPIDKTFMFTDIVSSTDLAGRLGDGVWQGIMDWHDHTLRAAFSRHGGVVVRHTGDGFFVTFDDPGAALRCAIEVQRLLDRNRREQGSVLTVRIGLHTGSAVPHQGDYAGQGVHVAARVAALAGREEIVATRAVVQQVGAQGFELSDPREEVLKGVPDPVTVYSVVWT